MDEVKEELKPFDLKKLKRDILKLDMLPNIVIKDTEEKDSYRYSFGGSFDLGTEQKVSKIFIRNFINDVLERLIDVKTKYKIKPHKIHEWPLRITIQQIKRMIGKNVKFIILSPLYKYKLEDNIKEQFTSLSPVTNIEGVDIYITDIQHNNYIICGLEREEGNVKLSMDEININDDMIKFNYDVEVIDNSITSIYVR